MPEEFKAGCKRPEPKKREQVQATVVEQEIGKGEGQAMVKVGQKAPDFSAPAFLQGKFVNVELSEYLGKWVVLCFYPGDFTFV